MCISNLFKPKIKMTITESMNPCTFLIQGTVKCGCRLAQSGSVQFTTDFVSGSGAVSIVPNPALITKGTFQATLTADSGTVGGVAVVATVTSCSKNASTQQTININCTATDPPSVYVANSNDNIVSVIDVATNTVINNILAGPAPVGVAVNTATNIITPFLLSMQLRIR
jgi:YVTN family beta-propeller protein